MKLDLFMRAMMPSNLKCRRNSVAEQTIVSKPSSYQLEGETSNPSFFQVPNDLTFEVDEDSYDNDDQSFNVEENARTVFNSTNYSNFSPYFSESSPRISNTPQPQENSLYHSTEASPADTSYINTTPQESSAVSLNHSTGTLPNLPGTTYQFSDEASGSASYITTNSENYSVQTSPQLYGDSNSNSLTNSTSTSLKSSPSVSSTDLGYVVDDEEIPVKANRGNSRTNSNSSSPFTRHLEKRKEEREKKKEKKKLDKMEKKEKPKKEKAKKSTSHFWFSPKPKKSSVSVPTSPPKSSQNEISGLKAVGNNSEPVISYELYENDENTANRTPVLVSQESKGRNEVDEITSDYILRDHWGAGNLLKAGSPVQDKTLYSFSDFAPKLNEVNPEALKKVKEEIEPEGTLRDEMIAKFIKRTSSTSIIRSRNWNTEFQAVLEGLVQLFGSETKLTKPEDIVRTFNWGRAHTLAQEFADTATTYARIIISEVFLPTDQKTFKPVDIGGVAGGSKYIVQNILFKFATDTMISHRPEMWMYGGKTPDHTAAAKTAKNEMNGREAFGSTYVEDLHFPMMTIIDYMGFRVVAVAIIPINKSTIKYGSNDAGATIHADNEELNLRMEQAGKRLNLKEHITGIRNKKKIVGPGDIEGHVTKDGEFYVVDFGRVFPPEDPSFRYGKNSNSRSVFYNLLRPQLVAANPVPLCSDAFTKWNSDEDVNVRIQHNKEVTDATALLYNSYVPQFAKHLDAMQFNWQELWGENAKKSEMLEALESVGPNASHKKFLNVRHLGRVRLASRSKDIKKLLLSVAVARVAKDDLKELMRVKMAEISAASTQPFKEVIVRFLNQLQGVCVTSDRYWTTVMTERLAEKFGEILEDSEKNSNIRALIDMRIVFILALKLTGTKLEPTVSEELFTSADFRFVEADIIEITPVVRHQSQIYLWGSLALMQKAIQMRLLGRKGTEIKRLITASEARAHEAHLCAPVCPVIDVTWAMTRIELMEIKGGTFINQKEIKNIEELLDYSAAKMGERPFIKTMRAHLFRCQSVLIETSNPKESLKLNKMADKLVKEAEDAPSEILCSNAVIEKLEANRKEGHHP